jgi:hypothetical protein
MPVREKIQAATTRCGAQGAPETGGAWVIDHDAVAANRGELRMMTRPKAQRCVSR